MGKRAQPRRFCHYCNYTGPPRFMVLCQVGCDLSFCRKCLTRYYKYSRTKCSKLPSVNWRCPVCTKKCQCEECQEVATVSCSKNKGAGKSVLYKKRNTSRSSEKIKKPNRKVISSRKYFEPSNDDRCRGSSNLMKEQSLPPFSSNLTFNDNIDFLCIPEEKKYITGLRPVCSIERSPILPGVFYQFMKLSDLLKFASLPFSLDLKNIDLKCKSSSI